MCKIREYEENDIKQIIDLWIEICINEYELNEWKEELEDIKQLDEYKEVIVAIDNEKVIGTMAYKEINPNIAELKRIYINKEYRGKGLSKKMLNTIMDKIRKNNYKKIMIETWKHFERGIEFYKKNNFELEYIEGDAYYFSMNLQEE